MLLFFWISISMPIVSGAFMLLLLRKCTPMTLSIVSLSSSYFLRKSCMYLFCVRGNLANGNIGELNFSVYILTSFFLPSTLVALPPSSFFVFALIVSPSSITACFFFEDFADSSLSPLSCFFARLFFLGISSEFCSSFSLFLLVEKSLFWT